jgi:pyridoxamine 5'-phosphate oxidase
MSKKPANLKYEYKEKSAFPTPIPKDPLNLFDLWFENALKKNISMANAMALATVDKTGQPHSRIVLLKEFDLNGFVFFTHYTSDKGRELEQNPKASLNFYWPDLEEQIRIEGKIKKTSAAVSDEYFYSRPHHYQLGALVSDQSKVIKNRSVLEKEFEKLTHEYKNKKVIRPKSWGGYILQPKIFEFWKGRASRLHDRIRYTRKQSSKQWQHCFLAP